MNYAITNRAYLFAISLALIMLMALACTTTPTATPVPTPDVPLFDKETVESLVMTHILGQMKNNRDMVKTCLMVEDCIGDCLEYERKNSKPIYIGNDIWVARVGICAFTFHDKKGHMILPQQDETTD